MKEILFSFTAFSVFLLFTHAAFTQTKISVEGVWRITEWVEGGKTITDPQPGLLIFTKDYYSVMILMAPRGDSVLPPKDRRSLTDAEKIERFELWRPLSAFSGTYEVNGSILVMRPIVAKNPWDMNRQTMQESELKPEGNATIWLIPTGDNATRVGMRMKLTRLE